MRSLCLNIISNKWIQKSWSIPNAPHDTIYIHCRSFRRRSSQPITWLILTNKTVQENTQTDYSSKEQTTQNTAEN